MENGDCLAMRADVVKFHRGIKFTIEKTPDLSHDSSRVLQCKFRVRMFATLIVSTGHSIHEPLLAIQHIMSPYQTVTTDLMNL